MLSTTDIFFSLTSHKITTRHSVYSVYSVKAAMPQNYWTDDEWNILSVAEFDLTHTYKPNVTEFDLTNLQTQCHEVWLDPPTNPASLGLTWPIYKPSVTEFDLPHIQTQCHGVWLDSHLQTQCHGVWLDPPTNPVSRSIVQPPPNRSHNTTVTNANVMWSELHRNKQFLSWPMNLLPPSSVKICWTVFF